VGLHVLFVWIVSLPCISRDVNGEDSFCSKPGVYSEDIIFVRISYIDMVTAMVLPYFAKVMVIPLFGGYRLYAIVRGLSN
jgi:hypothetical protein